MYSNRTKFTLQQLLKSPGRLSFNGTNSVCITLGKTTNIYTQIKDNIYVNTDAYQTMEQFK